MTVLSSEAMAELLGEQAAELDATRRLNEVLSVAVRSLTRFAEHSREGCVWSGTDSCQCGLVEILAMATAALVPTLESADDE